MSTTKSETTTPQQPERTIDKMHRETGIPMWALEIAFELSTLGMLDEETMAGMRVIPDTARFIAENVPTDLSPADAEQLERLREAATVALKWMDWWLDSELCECDGYGHVCGKTERKREADALRHALGTQEGTE